MKIIKFKKLKDNRYEIILDNELTRIFYDDLIVKYNLLTIGDFDSNFLNKITLENEEIQSYYIALKYLKNKLRSEKEIKEFLRKKEFNQNNIDNTIINLQKNGFLNEKLYLNAYINDQINLTNNGYYKILNNLEKLGFKDDIIKGYLDAIALEIWVNKLNKLISKKIKLNNKYSGNKLKEKIVYDLFNLGYAKEQILSELENYDFKDNELLEKEYQKIYKKLSCKYEGNELKYQIRNKLFQKGFSVDDINNIIE